MALTPIIRQARNPQRDDSWRRHANTISRYAKKMARPEFHRRAVSFRRVHIDQVRRVTKNSDTVGLQQRFKRPNEYFTRISR